MARLTSSFLRKYIVLKTIPYAIGDIPRDLMPLEG